MKTSYLKPIRRIRLEIAQTGGHGHESWNVEERSDGVEDWKWVPNILGRNLHAGEDWRFLWGTEVEDWNCGGEVVHGDGDGDGDGGGLLGFKVLRWLRLR